MSSSNPSSSRRVSEYSFPPGELGRKVLITGIIMALSSRKELLEPGSPLYDYLLAGQPTLLKAARWIQTGLFYFLFGAHAIETPLFAWTRLRPQGIQVLSLTWIKWVLSCFIGGKFIFEHFDRLAGKPAA
jgi:uncharacterized membrane protein